MNLRQYILVLTLLTVQLICIWTMDVSVATMNMGGVLTNGFIDVHPYKMYHIALWLLLLASFLQALFAWARHARGA